MGDDKKPKEYKDTISIEGLGTVPAPDKSLEQLASEDLAELEAEETPEDCRLSHALAELEALKEKVNTSQAIVNANQRRLDVTIIGLEDLKDTVHALTNELAWFRQRLHVVAPEPTVQTCTKCMRKLMRPGGKCGFCNHQN